jgi:hypothetical protein
MRMRRNGRHGFGRVHRIAEESSGHRALPEITVSPAHASCAYRHVFAGRNIGLP